MAQIRHTPFGPASSLTRRGRLWGVLLVVLGALGLINSVRIFVVRHPPAEIESKQQKQPPLDRSPAILVGLGLNVLMLGGGLWLLGLRPRQLKTGAPHEALIASGQDEVDLLSQKAKQGDADSLRRLLQIGSEERIENLLTEERPSKRKRIAMVLKDWPYGGALRPSEVQKIVYETALAAERHTPEEFILAIHDTDLVARTAADLLGPDPQRREGAYWVFVATARNPRKPASLRQDMRPVLQSTSPEVRLAGVRCLHVMASQIGKPHDLGDAKWAWGMLRAMRDRDQDSRVQSAAGDTLSDLTGSD